MRRPVGVLTLLIALVIGSAVVPPAAGADDRGRTTHRRPHHHRRFHGTVFVSPAMPRPCFGIEKHHHLVTFGCVPRVIVAPRVIWAPPVIYYAPPAVVPYPAYAAPVAPPAPPPPPLPQVIQYPTGRYELRGDGVTTPYTWVWIPNPPPPPATPPEPPPAPSAEPPPAAPTGSDAHSPPGEIYRWTDEQGVTTWTDKLDAVPERYRAAAQRPRQRN